MRSKQRVLLEHHVTTEMIDGKHSRDMQREKMVYHGLGSGIRTIDR